MEGERLARDVQSRLDAHAHASTRDWFEEQGLGRWRGCEQVAVRARTLEAERDNRPSDPNDGGAWSEARYHACLSLMRSEFADDKLSGMTLFQVRAWDASTGPKQQKKKPLVVIFPTAPTHLDTPPRSSLTSVNTPDPPFAGARTARSERARAALRGRHVIGRRRRRRRRRWAFVSLDALKTKWRWQQTNHAVSRADSPTLRRPFRRGGERLEHIRWDLVQGSRPVRRGAPAPAARRTVPARVGDTSGAGYPSGSIIFSSSSFQRCFIVHRQPVLASSRARRVLELRRRQGRMRVQLVRSHRRGTGTDA